MVDNKHTNLNLRLDLNNLSVSIEKLGPWAPQNFTAMLNKPSLTQPHVFK
jgi:uncharacterized protein (UPF0276 family)